MNAKITGGACVLFAALGFGIGYWQVSDNSQSGIEDGSEAISHYAEHEAKMISSMLASNRDCTLQQAIMNGNVHAVLRHLRGKVDLNKLDDSGYAPIHIAAMADRANIVYLLIKAGADATLPCKMGQKAAALTHDSATRQACRYGERCRQTELNAYAALREGREEEVIKSLLDGMNPNALPPEPEKDLPLFMEAMKKGSRKLVQALLDAGVDKNVNKLGEGNALRIAIIHNRADLIPLLLDAGVNPFFKDARLTSYAIHEAVWNNRTQCLKALIPLYKSTVGLNIDSEKLGYPIVMAIKRGIIPCCKVLLDAGLDPNDAIFLKEEPLLTLAVKRERKDLVQMLLQAGADKNALDKEGKRAIDYAQGEIADMLK